MNLLAPIPEQTPPVQTGLIYAARSAFIFGVAVTVVSFATVIGANLSGCEGNETAFLQCHINLNRMAYTACIGIVAAIGRFAQGYIASSVLLSKQKGS